MLPVASSEPPEVEIHPEVLAFSSYRRGSPVLTQLARFGTLGCFVKDAQGKLYIVTCAHVVMTPEEKLLLGCFIQKREIKISSKKTTADRQILEEDLGYPSAEAYIIHGNYDFKDIIYESFAAERTFIDIAVIPVNENVSPDCHLAVFVHDNCSCLLSFIPKRHIKVEKTGAATGTQLGEIANLQFRLPMSIGSSACFVNQGIKISDSLDGDPFGDHGDSGSLSLQPPPNNVCGVTPAAGLYWATITDKNSPKKSHLVTNLQLAFAAIEKSFGLHLTVCGNTEDFYKGLMSIAQGPSNNTACAVSEPGTVTAQNPSITSSQCNIGLQL